MSTHHPVTTLIASDSLILSYTPNKPYHSSTNPLCILVFYSLSVPPVVRMVLVCALYNNTDHSPSNPLCHLAPCLLLPLLPYLIPSPPPLSHQWCVFSLVRALYNNTDHSLSNPPLPPPPPSVPPVVRMVLVRALKAQVTEAVDAIEALKTVPEVREGMSERRGGRGSEGMRGGERRKGE